MWTLIQQKEQHLKTILNITVLKAKSRVFVGTRDQTVPSQC